MLLHFVLSLLGETKSCLRCLDFLPKCFGYLAALLLMTIPVQPCFSHKCSCAGFAAHEGTCFCSIKMLKSMYRFTPYTLQAARGSTLLAIILRSWAKMMLHWLTWPSSCLAWKVGVASCPVHHECQHCGCQHLLDYVTSGSISSAHASGSHRHCRLQHCRWLLSVGPAT